MYKKELKALKKVNRFRERKISKEDHIDLASNDYLGLAENKELLAKAYDRLIQYNSFAPKSSLLVNGYHPIHQMFEKKLIELFDFEDAIVVGSGFLANISLIQTLVRQKDLLLIDEEYHASGMLATKLISGDLNIFKHNNMEQLENLLKQSDHKRKIIAVEGIYSMSGDIAPFAVFNLAIKYNALLIVDEAHSSGVIGEHLGGIFDYYKINNQPNFIKMGTLGKAYGSYGAYICASSHIISFLENKAKALIYTTAPSLFDIALGYESLLYIEQNTKSIYTKIKEKQAIVKSLFNKDIKGLIVPILIKDNQKALDIQKRLYNKKIDIGAIRQPTVKEAIIRLIARINVDTYFFKEVAKEI